MKNLIYMLVGMTLFLGLQGCGKNSAPAEIAPSSGVPQLSVDPATQAQIQKIFTDVLNRLPTPAELKKWQELLSSGLQTVGQIRDAIAHSAEAQAAISALLTQFFGSSNQAVINQWVSILGTTMSLKEIIALFAGS